MAPYDIDPTTPADNDIVSQFPSNERTNRQTIENIVVADHDEGTGHHNKVHLLQQASDPTLSANESALYTKNVSGQDELFWKDENGVVLQLTKGGIVAGVLHNGAASSAASRTMAAALILNNAIALQAKDAGGTARNVLQIDGSDNLILGLTGAVLTKLILRGQAVSDLVYDYGSGNKKVWHEANDGAGSGLDADKIAGIANADVLTFDTSAPRYFISTAITPSSGSDGSQAHGLGSVPRVVGAKMKCTTSDRGYAVNDEVWLSGESSGTNNRGFGLWASSANVGYTIGSGSLRLVDKTSNDVNSITPSSWELYLLAWK